MIRDVKLIEHLPQFVQNYREIQHIMNAENPELQVVEDESEIIKNNLFIISSDLNGIKRFESILKISPSKDDTLESRISRVLTRWNDVVPYTWKSFINRLNTLCGSGEFTINKLFDIYQLEIETHLDLPGQVDELQYLFSYMIPSNLVVVSNNKLNFEISANVYIAAGTIYCSMFELSNDFKETYAIDNVASFGGGIVGSVECNISDNFQETIDFTGSELVGTGISYTSIDSTN